MFHHANNFVINGGQFTTSVNNRDAVSTNLCHYVTAGAMFDSDERQSAGRCHPRTRQRMIERVKKWIQGRDPAQRILWMYGSAGAGKSSLMQSICELLKDSTLGTHGASFFFSRGNTDRGKATKLFVTLAYQLAVQFPSVRARINDALHFDPMLPTKSMAIQLQSLIIDPILQCHSLPLPTPILFIDGLDECDADNNQGVDTQCEIISLISQSLMAANIPIHFMIASRPEYWIRDMFEISPLSEISLRLSLRDDHDADNDIKTYLTETFEQIRLRKKRVMRCAILPWPPKHVVDQFVEEASGQYIYASTILRFVGGHPFKGPEEQLQIILTPGPHRATAYSEVDRLYATILSAYPNWATMKRVLGGLLLRLNLIAIEVLLQVPRTEIILILDALCSLIDVVYPPPLIPDVQLLVPIFGSTLKDEKISFCHLSFRDFLLDEARSGLYYIQTHSMCLEVIGALLGLIQRNMDGGYEIEPHISWGISISEYRRMMDASIHVGSFLFYDFQKVLPALNAMMDRFRRFDPYRRMAYPACFTRDMDSLFGLFIQMKLNPREKDARLTDSFFSIVRQLQNLASMARDIGLHSLSLCDGFSVTHTLFFIRYPKEWGRQMQELSIIPGSNVDDYLSIIRQHRHIIDVLFTSICEDRVHLSLLEMEAPTSESFWPSGLEPRKPIQGLGGGQLYWLVWTNYGAVSDLKQKMDEGWLCHTEWTNQRFSLVSDYLKSFLNNTEKHWERLMGREMIKRAREFFLCNFFDDGDLSDICGEDFFDNEYHLSFLEVLIDCEAWSALSLSCPAMWPSLENILNPVLGWFDRQLTCPTSIRLIEDHNNSLLQRMTAAMNCIFQRCFMPIFKTPYFSELLITPTSFGSHRDTTRIKGLQSGLLEEVTAAVVPCEDYYPFELPTFLMREPPTTSLPTSQWYPCLAAYVFNIMVKDLYSKYRPLYGGTFGNYRGLPDACMFPRRIRGYDPTTRRVHRSTMYIIQCLPYAEPTPQNLDALRALKYLYNQVSSYFSWKPPVGFCSAARDLLKKYELSVLSTEEISDFEHWLVGIDEAPIENPYT